MSRGANFRLYAGACINNVVFLFEQNKFFMKAQLMKSDSNITIRVNKEVKQAIKRAAAQRGVSITAYLLWLATGTAEFSLINEPAA